MLSDLLTPLDRSLITSGRPGDPRLGERIQSRLDAAPAQGRKPSPRKAWTLLGCPDDSGVVENLGREGARRGPDSIRYHFFKMTPMLNATEALDLPLYDAGNIFVENSTDANHARTRAAVSELCQTGSGIVLLGGGHDFVFPGFAGFVDALQARTAKKSSKRVALLNIDPHLDVRERRDGRANSGTGFRDLLEAGTLAGRNLTQFGTRYCRNSQAAFAFCARHKVRLLPWEIVHTSPVSAWKRALAQAAKSSDAVGVTLDMDACRDSEGTSAAPVIGFSAWELCQMALEAGRCAKVGYFEIAEVAPPLDATERSSRVAAEVLLYFLHGVHKRPLKSRA